MNRVKKYSATVLVAGVLVTSLGFTGLAPAIAAPITKNTVQQPSVVLKWKETTLSQKGLISNGSTLIPVTVLRDQMGLPLTYNPASKTYSIGSGYKQLDISISEYGVDAYINNHYVNEYEVKNIGGRLYVPFKLMSDYLGYQGVWNPPLKSLSITPRVENDIVITTKSEESKTKDASFLLQYPTISGLENAAAEKEINAMLEKVKKQFVEAANEQAALRDGTVEHPYEFLQNYLVTYNQNGMLSLVMNQYSYTGGAHGMNNRIGLTFSLQDGKLLSIDDLLKEKNPTYKVGLDKFLLKSLQGFEGYYGDFKGLGADVDYYLKTDGLALFFQQYEYAPYAAGNPTFVIPFDQVVPKANSLFE
ncbi:PdaC/SigV domain-containing protein [Paenibacillus glacialis]|uniref:Copper amine oxidase n=1 Tax=Paenibacillus glacialis TaxID=494026 RepID=A0A168KM75_9BACL|nr:DUF4163 domain-containing protein [Paenibacillus glacialis]OAB42204.1 hypothetical protein PGLA_12905 [Paenibacillus glacialis]